MTGRSQQLLALAGIALGGFRGRIASAVPALLTMAGCTGITVGLLAIADGFRATLVSGAEPDNAIVLRRAAIGELVSVLSPEEVATIRAAPGIARRAGRPRVSPELVVVLSLPGGEAATATGVTLRGVGPGASGLRDGFAVVEGRMLRRGRNEMIVGTAAKRRFGALEVGDEVPVAGQRFPIVGVFSTGGREDSELWGDLGALQGAFRRGATVQTVIAKLAGPAGFDRLREALEHDPRVDVDVTTHRAYYHRQADSVEAVVLGIGSLLVLLTGLGAFLATLDAGYAAVDTRARELATLRVFGYSRVSLVLSTVVESLALSAVGGAFGVGATAFALDGRWASTLDFYGFSQFAFQFDVSGRAIVCGIALVALVGALGGLIPAVRAMGRPIPVGLRG